MKKRRMIQGLLILALLCGAVLLAHPTAAWALDGTGSKEDPYRISSAADLQEFAELVNGGQTTANAELTADITINSNVLGDNGALNGDGSDFTKWTPIGDGSKPYTGTFDGAGHTISGLYIDSDVKYAGLFGYIGTNGTVKNLALADSSINSSRSSGDYAYVGGICGKNDGSIENCSNSGTVTGNADNINVGGICGLNWGSITSCSNSGTVTCSGTNVGGICGVNSSIISNCSNSGTVTGSDGSTVGGICGYNWGSITNCSNSGTVTGSGSNVGGICGYKSFEGSITNCYWLRGTAGAGIGVGVGGGSGTVKKVEEKTDAQFASGEVAWLLNEGQEDGPWRQNLTGTNRDAFPTLDQTHHIVIYVDQKYTNDGHKYQNGFCTICGSYESATQDASGTYQINNAGQLYWFAGLVNGTLTDGTAKNPAANAVLTENITINSNVLDDNGALNGDGSGFTQWTPIGTNYNNRYTGTFDGAGYKISGLYIDSDATYAGLFGRIGEGGRVQNLTLADSHISGGIYVGGICGYNDGGCIENCSNSGTVNVNGGAYTYVGGICGWNDGGSITTCSNSGIVTGSGDVGGICGNNWVSITNCYWLATAYTGEGVGVNEAGATVTEVLSKNADQYTSGEVAWLLNQGQENGPWRQTLGEGKDAYPTLDESHYIVYRTAFYANNNKENNIIISYNNAEESVDVPENPTLPDNDCSFGGWYASNTFAESDKLTTTSVIVTSDKEYWAKWTANVRLNVNGGTINSGNVTSYTYGTETTLPTAQDITRTGYTFGGWYDHEEFSGEPVETITATDTGNKIYYAKWTANTYKVTLITNDGTIADGKEVTSYTYGTETTLPTDVTRSGYTFGGWYDNEALSGDPVTAISADATGDQTYWAKWTAKQTPPPTIPPTVSEETIDAIADAAPGETVTVDLSHGSTKLDKEVFETLAGKDVTLVVDLGDGVSWTVNGTDIPEDADFTDIDMGVTMNSDGIPVDIINAITGEHGSVQVELAHNGAFGFTMTLTAPLGAENAGYWANLYHFKVNDGEAGREGPLGDDEDAGKMTFETAAQIGSDGSVSLAFSHASQYAIVIDDHNHGVVTLPFTDVSEGDWFYEPVCYVYENGLMTGTSADTFEPNTPLSRAMLVAVLHRLEGSPAASGGDFTDVADGDWYAQAVNWAASVGVVNGFDDGTFQPNTAITREQLAAILMNYAQYKGQDVSARATLDTYNDATAISSWANDVMSWAVAEGLLTGVTNDQLQPQGNATRAQVAAILQRFLDN